MTQYIPRLPPYKHQTAYLEALTHRPVAPSSADVFAILAEMGTGKSKMICDEFGMREYEKDLDTLLIIAPKGVYSNWIIQEIPRHLSDDLQERMLVGTLDLIGGAEQRERVRRLLRTRDRPRILVVNVEAFSTVDRVREACFTFLAGCGDRAMIAIDEATSIKGHGYYDEQGTSRGSKRSAFIVERLAPMARVRRIATGLVAPNSPLDIYAQYAFLDWRILGHWSYFGFRQTYCITKKKDFTHGEGRASRVVVGFRNEAELQKKISKYSFRVLKKDCLDLPEQIYYFRDVEMTAEQRRVYDEIRDEAISEFESTRVTALMVTTRVMRLHQIACGYVVDDDGAVHHLRENRTAALIETLQEHSGKAIIWAPYREVIRKIAAELRRVFPPDATVEYWGDTRQRDRDEARRRFAEDDRCRYFVGNPSVGGEGIDLISADLTVYYANSWNLRHRLQSEDRMHRIGQIRTCLYQDIRCPGTVDDKVIERLRKKIDVAGTITGDDWRSWLI